MVIVIGAPSPPLTIVIPNGHRIQFVVCARFRKKGSDLGYEDMIKYAIKELKTNNGGIVTASERFQPVRPLCYILPLSRKKYETANDSLFCLTLGRHWKRYGIGFCLGSVNWRDLLCEAQFENSVQQSDTKCNNYRLYLTYLINFRLTPSFKMFLFCFIIYVRWKAGSCASFALGSLLVSLLSLSSTFTLSTCEGCAELCPSSLNSNESSENH